MEKGIEMDRIEKTLLPFALIGSETHDTEFTVRIVDKDQHEIGRVDQDDFKRVYELLLDIKSTFPKQEVIPDPIQMIRKGDDLKDIIHWFVMLWAFAATILLITR